MATYDYMRTVRPMVAKLAADADVQVRSRPAGFSFAADVLEDAELIFETALGQHGRGLSPAEKQVVADLHSKIEITTADIGRGDSFWTDSALQSHPKWEAIRVAAREALAHLDRLRGPMAPPQ
jgi:hypothetical protein